MRCRTLAATIRNGVALLGVCLGLASGDAYAALTFTYQGRFLTSDGTAPLTDTANITFSIYNSSGTCLLEQEVFNGIDLSLMSGVAALSIGTGTRTGADPGLTMEAVLSNRPGVLRATAADCVGGYSPSAADGRILQVHVHIPSRSISTDLTPSLKLDSVPLAYEAQKLQGYQASDFILAQTPVTQANLNTLTNGSNADSLHRHDAYVKVGAANPGFSILGGQTLGLGQIDSTSEASLSGLTPGSVWYNSTTQVLKYYDGTNIVAIGASGVSGGGGGPATNFTGALTGDVRGTQSATVVASVSGVSASNVASGVNAANSAASVNTVGTLVKRDGSGNFSAGTITATNFIGAFSGSFTGGISGNAAGFTGGLSGDVTGTQNATTVGTVGGLAAASVASGANAANAATASASSGKIVSRDSSGNFSAGTVFGNLSGNATSATSFSGALTGDVTGTQGATHVAQVGGLSAASVASGASAANAASPTSISGTIVMRNSLGNFTANTIFGDLFGTAQLATLASTAVLANSVSGSVTTNNLVFGASAATGGILYSRDIAGNASWNPLATLDSSGNLNVASVHSVGAISASGVIATSGGIRFPDGSLQTSASTGVTGFTGTLAGDVTGSTNSTVVSLVGTQSAANVASGVILANAATATGTTGAIVRRDASGNFSAASITAALNGNAATASFASSAGTATSASYATFASSATSASFATLAATASSAGYATLASTATSAAYATLAGTATTASYATLAATAGSAALATSASYATSAGSAVSFTGALTGDVTGTQGSTVVSSVSATAISGLVPVSKGGTNASSVIANGVIYGGAGGTSYTSVLGSSGQVLMAASGGAPTFTNTLSGLNSVTASGTITGANLVGTLSGSVAAPTGGLTVGANQLVVTATGVGIGTTGPTAPLSVVGNAYISGTLTAGSFAGPISGTNGSYTSGLSVGGTGITITGGETLSGGLNNNSGGITNVGTISGASTIAGSGAVSVSAGGAGALSLSTAGTGSFTVGTSGATRLTVDSSGNVGIGTTTPDSPLEVWGGASGGGNSNVIQFDFPGSGTSSDITRSIVSSWKVQNSTYIGTRIDLGFSNTAAHTSPFIAFRTGNALGFPTSGDNTIERMRVNSDGHVGIGTTAPTNPLSVVGNANFSGTVTAASFSGTFSGSNGVYSSGLSVGGTGITVTAGGLSVAASGANITGGLNNNSGGITNAGGLSGVTTITGSTTLALASSGANSISFAPSGSTAMTIASAGNVGIGTSAPNSLLTLGPAMTGSALSATLSTNAGALGNTTGNDLTIGSFGFTSSTNASHLGIHAYRTSADTTWTGTSIGLTMDVDNVQKVGAQLWLSNTGNVGIGGGMENPSAKLQVNGAVSASGGGTFAGDGAFTGNGTFNGTLKVGTGSGGAASPTFRSYGGSLGGTATNEVSVGSLGFNSGNESYLGVHGYRITNGTDWTTASIGLSMDVDNVPYAGGAQLWLSPSGNVGIGAGTQNPNAKLQVNGTITATAFSGSFAGTTGTYSGLLTASSGLTVSSGLLTVSSGGASITGLVTAFSGINLNNQGIAAAGPISGITSISGAGAVSLSAGGAGALSLSTAGTGSFTVATSGATRMTVNSNGNIGIGTTAPAARLDIRYDGDTSSGGTPLVRIVNAGGTFQDYAGINLVTDSGNVGSFYKNSSTNTGYAGASSLNLGTSAAENLGFTTNNFTRMMINAAGNVGIGTTTPIWPLDIVGQMALHSYAANNFYRGYMANGTAASPSGVTSDQLLTGVGGNGYGATGFSATSRASIKFYAGEAWTDTAQGAYTTFETTATGATSNLERVRITASGNVGIGTTSPTQKLTVAGLIESTSGGIKFPDGTTQATASGTPLSFGVNSVSGSRALVTVYQNTTSTPIFVEANVRNGSGLPGNVYGCVGTTSSINTTCVTNTEGSVVSQMSVASGWDGHVFFVVPVNYYYEVYTNFSSPSIRQWTENPAIGGGGGTQWGTSGSNVFYSSGNVGIGTTSPTSPLTVAGTIQSTSGGVMFPDGSLQTTASHTGAAYGSFYNTTTIVPSTSAWTNVSFNGQVVASSTITHSNSVNPERIGVTTAGTYEIRWNIQINCNSAIGTAAVRLITNGSTEIAGTYGTAGFVNGSNYSGVISGTTIVTLNANDYVTVQSTSNNASFAVQAMNVGGGASTLSNASVSIIRLK